MAGNLSISPDSVPVAPGSTGTCSVRIRNTGSVVDEFSLTVLGDATAWTVVAPQTLSLFPGTDGTIELHFSPPRGSAIAAGALPFGVRLTASQDPDGSVVEEANLQIQPFHEIVAKITPRTSEAKRSARHEVIIENRGNVAIEAELEASDPDEQLVFDVKPRVMTIEAGASGRSGVKVAARKGFARGADKHRPFTVMVNPGLGQPAARLDANMIQHAGLPRMLFPAVAMALALGLIVFVAIPMMRGEDGTRSGLLKLTSDKGDVTTTTVSEEAKAAAEAEKDAAEAKAAADAELAANGKDPSSPGAAGSGGASGGDSTGGSTGASSTGGGTSGGSTGGSTSGGETTVTAKPATPSTTAAPTGGGGGATSPTTTAAPAGGGGATSPSTTAAPTTTAAPNTTYKKFVGSWVNTANSGDTLSITTDDKSMAVSRNDGRRGGSSVSDANDGSMTVKYSDGSAQFYSISSDGATLTITTPFVRGSSTYTRAKLICCATRG